MAFNENTRVKIPALIHLERLGYKYLSLKTSKWDPDTNIFTGILDESLSRINPAATPEELETFKKKSLASLDNDDLGKVFYSALIAQSGLRLIDFENFNNNTFSSSKSMYPTISVWNTKSIFHSNLGKFSTH